MPSLSPLLLPLLLLLLLLLPPISSSSSVFEILAKNNLPAGLLPRTIKNFRMSGDGSFEVEVEGPCTAKFESEVRYEAVVSGNISYGEIGALRGVSAQELFLWFPVKEIHVEDPTSGVVYFDVGVVHKQFSRSLFDTPPECHRVEEEVEKEEAEEGGGVLAEGYAAARLISETGKLRYTFQNNKAISADAMR